ncbi:MAG: hypothetical protein J07AB43_12630 [Candidatus Nanosalina sp. J07AB43]|nr:MAG: hypothetical protein J07AB43_12630 [Candidatus Nanosalina sp. J07AB43]
MVETKNIILGLALLLFVVPVAGIGFAVDIEPTANQNTKDLQVKNNFSHVFELNASVFNSGSFECRYRFRAEINETGSGDEFTAYSKAVPIPPGAFDRVKVFASPYNYTGMIRGELFIEYCDKTENVTTFKANSTERTVLNNTLQLDETSVNSTQARAELDVDNALLIPRDSPKFWKVGSTEVENGTTYLDYRMPFRNFNRNITYAAFNSSTGKPIGTVKADLKVERDFIDKVFEKKYQIGLALSFLLNIALLVLIGIKRGFKAKALNAVSH